MLHVRRTVVDNPSQRIRVIVGTARRTPDTADTKFSATTLVAFVRAIQFSPGVRSADFKTPTFCFCMPKRFFDFLLRVN
jgi:hypothetical protein